MEAGDEQQTKEGEIDEIRRDLQLISLENRFQNLDKDKQEELLKYSPCLNMVENLQNGSSYIPRTNRTLFMKIIEYLEESNEKDDQEFMQLLSKPTTDVLHYEKPFRDKVLNIVQKWLPIIDKVGNQLHDRFFLRNGRPSKEFTDWLKHTFSGKVACGVTKINGVLEVLGKPTVDEFYELLKEFDSQYLSQTIYYHVDNSVDESFRYGDPYSKSFVVESWKSFPHSIQRNFSISGRGTAGCVVSIAANGHSIDYILTAEHVSYGWLNPDGNEEEQHDKLVFNAKCPNATYLRGECDMDYAFMPCTLKFSIYDLQSSDLNFFDGDLRKNLLDFWDQLITRPLFGHEFDCFKVGQKTGHTHGTFNNMIGNGIIKVEMRSSPYSDKSDSGALVFMQNEDDNCYYPVGLHYAGNGVTGSAIPLWSVFKDYCAKNDLKTMKVNFLEPKLGRFVFSPDKF